MDVNLRGVDLNLLPVFEAAYEERSLSRAARRLAMTQPAVSHALARLRIVFRDDLFIRHSRGMNPTAGAEAIYARLHDALDTVRGVLLETADFDPAVSARRFFLSIPHPLGPTIALLLIERLAQRAPHFKLEFSTHSRPTGQEKSLYEGRTDLLVDWLPAHDEQLRSELLFEDRMVIIARAGHPVFDAPITPQSLDSAAFVSLRQRADEAQRLGSVLPSQIDALPRVLEVSELLEILFVVSRSDLFGLMFASMARMMAQTFDIRVLDKPEFVTPAFPVQMVWHPRRDDDPAHRFLREEIRMLGDSLLNG